MNSIIFKMTSKLLAYLIFAFALFIFIRGHNQPGGGFIGGLIFVSGLALLVMSHGVEHAKRFVKLSIPHILAIGALCSLIAGVLPMFFGKPFLTGLWLSLGPVYFGTPMLFDFGIFLTVVGAVFYIVTTLESKPEDF